MNLVPCQGSITGRDALCPTVIFVTFALNKRSTTLPKRRPGENDLEGSPCSLITKVAVPGDVIAVPQIRYVGVYELKLAARNGKGLEIKSLFSREGKRARTGDLQLGNTTIAEAQYAGLSALRHTRRGTGAQMWELVGTGGKGLRAGETCCQHVLSASSCRGR